MKFKSSERQAVAPVLATLLMIAVAVAMSVIIFMWSQGFLSQTSSATGGQQGAQNQAAQSSISIELATFTTTSGSPQITVIIRNVGAVSVTLGSVTVNGLSSNTGFQGTLVGSALPTTGTNAGGTCPCAITGTVTATPTDGTWSGTLVVTSTSKTATAISLAKGSSAVLTLSGSALPTPTKTQVTSGDVLSIKVTTNVGTFAQAQFTVP